MKSRKPQRRCVGCGQSFDQSSLIRIKRDKDGRLSINTAGDGRSAYICRNARCIEISAKKRGLERSFRASVDRSIYDELEKTGIVFQSE